MGFTFTEENGLLKKYLCAALAVAALNTGAGAAKAAVIGFDGLSGGYTGSIEDGFQITALDPFTVNNVAIGNPVPSIYINGTSGTVEIVEVAGRSFTFQSFDLGQPITLINPSYSVLGFQDNLEVLNFSGIGPDSLVTFLTVNNINPGLLLDKLQITISSTIELGANLDNINLTAVPLPASGLLLLGGLGVLAASRRKRRSA